MKKVLNLDLDYELDKQRDEKAAEGAAKVPENPEITRNIIENAYAINHPSMDAKTARQWRSIVKLMDEVLEDNKVFLILSDSDFSSIYDEIYKCEFPHQQAFIVPVLLDELDRVKNRSQKEAKEILETILMRDEVLQISKANPS